MIVAERHYSVVPLCDGLTLRVADGVPAALADRFAVRFNVVFRSLPKVWRDRLLAHWRKAESRREVARKRRAAGGAQVGNRLPPAPWISLDLMSLEALTEGGRRRGETAACCGSGGHEIRFLSQFLEGARDRVIDSLIAHEVVGHGIQFALVERDPLIELAHEGACELQAESIAFALGYSITPVARYENKKFKNAWKLGLPVPRAKRRRLRRPRPRSKTTIKSEIASNARAASKVASSASKVGRNK